MRASRVLLLLVLLAATHGAAFLVGYGPVQETVLVPDRTQAQMQETRSAEANVLAVTSNGTGNIGSVEAKIEPGQGRVLLDTNPFVETDTQLSAQTSARVASRITSTNLEDRDVTYSFTIRGTHLGGPSAGAAMTVATVAAIRNETVRSDGAITGTVRPDGHVGRVGGVLEKAVAAGESDISLLLVPHDQTEVTYYRRAGSGKVVEPGLVIEGDPVEPVRVDLNGETKRRFGMETRGVRTAEEATDLLVTQR